MIRRSLVLAGLLLASLPAVAGAVVVPIDGAPLNVFVNDRGQMQVRFDGATSGEFFSPGSDEPNAGFTLGVIPAGGQFELFGFLGTAFTPVDQGPVTGDGSAGSPFEQVTRFRAPSTSGQGDAFLVTQTTSYVNGTTDVRVRYAVQHETGSGGGTVRPAMSADLYVSGSDSGVGFLNAGPPRLVGGINQEAGASGGILEITPWGRFEEDGFSTVFSHVQDPDGTALDNSVNPQLLDNGVAVQWPDTELRDIGASQTVETAWRFTRFQALTLEPAEASLLLNEVSRVKATAVNPDGSPSAGQTLRYRIDGSNPAAGAVNTGADGAAEIPWRGRNSGSDLLTVHWDIDNDGVRQPNEPERTATVNWLQPPTAGVTIGARPVRGEVFFKPPRGSALARRLAARPAQAGVPRGFQPLPAAGILPVGSTLDTSKGRVMLQSAKGTRGGVQNAILYAGRFTVRQSRLRRAVTDLVMSGGSFRRCGSLRKSTADGPEANAARRGRRVRRLWGNGRGRFRTRGRYSSATVRGTTWLVQDHCNGTLTRVARRPRTNRVDVRDFGKRRTVRLRAGQSYFAPRRR